MDTKIIVLVLFLSLFMKAEGQAFQVFDIVAKYGAKADSKTDASQPIMKAFADACAAAGPTKVVVPSGTFFCGAVNLTGPCKGPVTMDVRGTLKAPSDPAAIKEEGWFSFNHIDGFTLTGGGTFDGQGEAAWKANDREKDKNDDGAAMNLRFNFLTNSVVAGVTSLNSKNFHVNVLGCEKMIFRKFTVTAPVTSLNTDGIHIGRSKGVTITESQIGTGDDCISIGDGTVDLKVTKVTCGPGHGISIGSLGRYPNEEPVDGVLISGCTLTGTDNGVRIKSWPAMEAGTATNLRFEDITMKDVMNPVLIDQEYCPYGQCSNKGPSKVKLSGVSFSKIKGTSKTPLAVNLVCSSGIPCEKVELADIDLTYSGAEGPAKSACKNVKPVIKGKLNPPGC